MTVKELLGLLTSEDPDLIITIYDWEFNEIRDFDLRYVDKSNFDPYAPKGCDKQKAKFLMLMPGDSHDGRPRRPDPLGQALNSGDGVYRP